MNRFWSKVKKTDSCWLWIAARDQKGYGRFGFNGKNVHASRVSWFLEHGKWPNIIRHTCDNPPCVNPHHLLDGTIKDNVADMVLRKRHWAQRYGMPRGMNALYRKLESHQVIEIRRLCVDKMPMSQIAERFGVSKGMVCMINQRKYWSHI